MYDPFKVKDAGRDQPPVCYRAGMTAEDWPAEQYGISFEAVRLFEAMPRTFTFDEVIEKGEEYGLTSSESAAAAAEWQTLGMVAGVSLGASSASSQALCKTGEKPYF